VPALNLSGKGRKAKLVRLGLATVGETRRPLLRESIFARFDSLPASAERSVSVSDAIGTTRRFYRVITPAVP
jgi:hypothetical protein